MRPRPILRTWISGLARAAADAPLVALLFAATALTALLPGIVLYNVIESRTATTIVQPGEPANLDFLGYSEIEAAAAGAFGVLGQLEWLVAAGYLMVMLFASGGLVERAAFPDSRFDPVGFLAACSRQFRGILVLAAAAGIAYAGVIYLHGRAAVLAEEAAAAWESEGSVVLVQIATHLMAALVLAVIAVVFRYARIVRVLDARSVTRSIRAGAAFVVAQPLATVALQAMAAATGLVLLVSFSYLQNTYEPVSTLAIAIWMVGLQGLLLLRVGLRVAIVDAEVALWQNLGVPRSPMVAMGTYKPSEVDER
jgi:hypothetical protein